MNSTSIFRFGNNDKVTEIDLFFKASSANEINRKPYVGLSLRANFSWTFFGNILYAVTQWGLLILLTKLFDPELFGRYALALSIVTPISVASMLQLRVVYVSAVEDEFSFADYLLLRLVTTLLTLLILVGLTTLDLLPAHLSFLVLLLGCNQAVEVIKDLFQGVMQKQERMDLVSISKILRGSTSIAAAAVMAFLTHNILLVVVGMLIARFLTMLLYDIPHARALVAEVGPLVTKPAIQRALSLSRLFSLAQIAFPLGVVTLLISLNLNIPRYFLADFGEAMVGYFAAIASLMSLQNLVIGALGRSAVRRLALYYSTDVKRYIRLLGQLIAIGVAVGVTGIVIVIVFGRPLLTIFFREEYAGFVDLFFWLMVVRLVMNAQSFLGHGLTAARMFKIQMWIRGLALAALLVCAWLLIPTWSVLGAAWAMLIAACVTVIASVVVMAKNLDFREKV